ncbi:helix-turn-helix domain-containing protein [Carnobacterium antarcticum]|uniref:Helix-turn-helix domain-containing protein n=1 Tax=Carnobacterium antarcticum TaxID=2126436 RepID=A0ABW4NUM1_9LACT|nr:helix-turn-helix transcriptional regulator [Carnobacterium sp. CP1]ALV23057.1 Transcriptional regulator XRE [Carnobacterium sp. CP1]
MNLATRLKQKRNDLQLTQEEIAEKIHISRQTISNWENGRNLPDINSLVLISEIYAISLDELMKGDPEMVKQFDKKGNYFTVLAVLSGAFILLTIFHLISPGEVTATLLFFGTLIIVFLVSNLLILWGLIGIKDKLNNL